MAVGKDLVPCTNSKAHMLLPASARKSHEKEAKCRVLWLRLSSRFPGRTASTQQRKEDREEDDHQHDAGSLTVEGSDAQIPVPMDANTWRLACQCWQWHGGSRSCSRCSCRNLHLAGKEGRHPSAKRQQAEQR